MNPVTHQCGFVGCRVGEASNPGPVLTRRGRRAEACHDTHIDVSSDEEPLVRPNMGRDVIARTEASGECNAESHIRSTRAGSTVASDATPGRDVLLYGRQTLETTQPATPVALRTAGVITDRNTGCGATMPASPGALIAANRFFHLATDSESDSSTEEVPMPRRRPSRLVLVSQNVPVTAGAMEQEPPAEGHERRFRRVRQAMRMDRGVGKRQVEASCSINQEVGKPCGSRDWGGDSERNSPPSVVCFECSTALGCSRRRQCPMIQCLREVSQSLPMVPVAGVQMAGPDAVMMGVIEGRDAKHRDSFSRTVRRMDPQPRFLHAEVGRLHQRKGARTHFEHCSRTRCAGVSIGVSFRVGDIGRV